MKLRPDRLLPAEHGCYYLYGEDEDAVFEAADSLLAAGDSQAVRLRVDVSELARVEAERRSPGLFGATCCYALVRNAASATPKQTDHLLKLAGSVEPGNRLIICAPGIEWKKALHKRLQAEGSVAQCEFHKPDEQQFRRWLMDQLQQAGLCLDEDALAHACERLCGMRLAARQLIERLQLYAPESGAPVGLEVVGALLGERSPEAVEAWCHAVAMRESRAVRLARRLAGDGQVAEVQMVTWLATRMQQLLLYRWHEAKRHRNPLQAANLFGEARRKVPMEARQWHGSELAEALQLIVQAEKLIKGASVEGDAEVIEQLTMRLVRGGETA